MRLWFLVCAVSLCTTSFAQQNDTVGDFTRSPTEHIINTVEQPFVVHSVKGVVMLKTSGPREPLKDVLFEIQGSGADRKIRRATTDENGRFKMGHIPAGTYRFKATLNGFQSVMGTIIVSRAAAQDNQIEIAMPLGV